MAEERKEICSVCAYGEVGNRGYILCHKNPEEIKKLPANWCGEFKAKPKVKPKKGA